MNKLILIIFTFLFLKCNSKTENKEPKIEIKKVSKKETKSIESGKKENNNLIIYDTLVFEKNMVGELLNEKYKTSQNEIEFYKEFINSKKINQLKVIEEKHIKTEIKYLGELKDLNKKNSYHVITNFKIIGIGQMLSPRGRSEVAFVDKKNNNIMVYDLEMPHNLPKYIEKNILYFEIEKTKIGISISGGFAPLLCIPKIGCN